MQRLIAAAIAVLAAVLTGLAIADSTGTNKLDYQYAVGLWGDLPYSDVQATTGVPNLLADMNASDIAFSVHDGDLKAGSGTPGSSTPSTCSDEMYAQALGYLNTLVKPAM